MKPPQSVIKQIQICLPYQQTRQQAERAVQALRGQCWPQEDGTYVILAIDRMIVCPSANGVTYQADVLVTAERAGPLPGLLGILPTPKDMDKFILLFFLFFGGLALLAIYLSR